MFKLGDRVFVYLDDAHYSSCLKTEFDGIEGVITKIYATGSCVISYTKGSHGSRTKKGTYLERNLLKVAEQLCLT